MWTLTALAGASAAAFAKGREVVPPKQDGRRNLQVDDGLAPTTAQGTHTSSTLSENGVCLQGHVRGISVSWSPWPLHD